MVVGGLAVHYYIPERKVDDLDILIEPSQETHKKLLSALNSPYFKPTFTAEQIAQPKKIRISVKVDFNLDILTPAPEMDFSKEWDIARVAMLGITPVRVAAIETLLKLLISSQEPKHLRDVALLKQVNR